MHRPNAPLKGLIDILTNKERDLHNVVRQFFIKYEGIPSGALQKEESSVLIAL